MVCSIFTIIFVQGYWIYFTWKNKESEFSLAVQQSLQIVAKEVQEPPQEDLESRDCSDPSPQDHPRTLGPRPLVSFPNDGSRMGSGLPLCGRGGSFKLGRSIEEGC